MKLLHDYTDEELLHAFTIEVLGYRFIESEEVSSMTFTVHKDKYCFKMDNFLCVADEYSLSDGTTKVLGNGEKFGYTFSRAKIDVKLLIELLNKFLSWESSKWTVGNSLHCFNIKFDSHIQRHYKIESGSETSFERAALIALLLHVRNTDNQNQTVRPY